MFGNNGLSGFFLFDELEFQNAKEDYLELRQEENDIREYSNTNLIRLLDILAF